jgi:hypothetical protein
VGGFGTVTGGVLGGGAAATPAQNISTSPKRQAGAKDFETPKHVLINRMTSRSPRTQNRPADANAAG